MVYPVINSNLIERIRLKNDHYINIEEYFNKPRTKQFVRISLDCAADDLKYSFRLTTYKKLKINDFNVEIYMNNQNSDKYIMSLIFSIPKYNMLCIDIYNDNYEIINDDFNFIDIPDELLLT